MDCQLELDFTHQLGQYKQELVKRARRNSDIDIPSLAETTGEEPREKQRFYEDRIVNKDELLEREIFSYAFCIICQEVIMPKEKKPVFCKLCQSVAYCTPCIQQWMETKNECCHCGQDCPDQFQSASSRIEFAEVFDIAKIRCSNYPNCDDTLSLNEIEEHEQNLCRFNPCEQCNRSLKVGTVSMQVHLQLHCEETVLPCQFCKLLLKRRELMAEHSCREVIPACQHPILPETIVNQEIVTPGIKSVTTCFYCRGFLRIPLQCSSCLISFCQRCIDEANSGKQAICPGPGCTSSEFEMISRVSKNFLSKLQIKCEKCYKVVPYGSYADHQLQHQYCKYCSELLKSWTEIREHYYEKCAKFKVHCHNCDFGFTRENYVNHDCLSHQDLRLLEMLLLTFTMIIQGITIGLLKRLSLSECDLIDGIRSWGLRNLINIILLFWAICMIFNFRALAGPEVLTPIHLKVLATRKDKRFKLRLIYLGMAAVCVGFITINTVCVKFNQIIWCQRAENYEYAKEHANQHGIFQSETHYILTLLNMLCYSATFQIFRRTQKFYEKSKYFLQHKKTPKKVKEE